MLEQDEDEELDSMILPSALPCRGRESLGESQAPLPEFTCEDLDALADLPQSAIDSLISNDPTQNAEDLLRARIKAAKRLKYGGD